MEENKFKLSIRISSYWINFLFYFTLLTIAMSIYIFIIGEDKQFVPVRIVTSMLFAKLTPLIKAKN